jgi:hypothetical protein
MALLRKKTPPSAEEPEKVVIVKAGGKGRATPKRKEAVAARRDRPTARSSDPKEARRQARDDRRQKSQTYRDAMLSGDVDRLPPRERVPERVLARETVDARRNFGPIFLVLLLLNFASGLVPAAGVRYVFTLVLMLALVVFVIDGVFVSRAVTTAVHKRYPGSRVPVKMYAIQRAILPGRFRMPRPRGPVAGFLPASVRARARR